MSTKQFIIVKANINFFSIILCSRSCRNLKSEFIINIPTSYVVRKFQIDRKLGLPIVNQSVLSAFPTVLYGDSHIYHNMTVIIIIVIYLVEKL